MSSCCATSTKFQVIASRSTFQRLHKCIDAAGSLRIFLLGQNHDTTHSTVRAKHCLDRLVRKQFPITQRDIGTQGIYALEWRVS
jgi:hypothetical protein